MIEQVKDIANLSNDWLLTTDQRVDLYFSCAQALTASDDSTSAFKVYYEAFKLIEGSKGSGSKFQKEKEELVISAIKSP
jgi:hypothetical protein